MKKFLLLHEKRLITVRRLFPEHLQKLVQMWLICLLFHLFFRMSHTDKDILEELYRLEPKLQENEAAILEILAKMRRTKPEIIMNGDFREQLKSEIMAKLCSENKKSSFLSQFSFSLPIFSTAFACLLIGVFVSNLPVASLFQKNPSFMPQIVEIDTPFSGATLQYSRPAPAVNQPMALA